MRTLLGVLVVAVCLAPAASAAPLASNDAGTSNDAVTITVTVQDATGDPIGDANVTVSYDDTEQTEQTFSNGKALFDVPEGADVSVDANHPDRALNFPETVADVDGSTEVTLTMYTAATAALTVKTPDGEPIEGASVRMKKDDEVLPAVRAETGSDGTLEVQDLEQGNYSIQVTSAGYYQKETSLYIVNRAGKTVSLEPGTVSVEFETVDEHAGVSKPVAANVVLYKGDTVDSNISTGESGSRSVSVDVNSRYEVVVKKPGYESQRHVLETDESDSAVTYELNRTPSLSVSTENSQVVTGQTVRVMVRDEYDDPVSGASVRVDGETAAETDENGNAVVTIEEEGDVEITAISGAVESSTTVEGVSTSSEETTTERTTAEPTTTEATTTAEPTEEPTTEETTASGDDDDAMPGFGGVVAVLALAVTLLALARRDER